MQKGYDDEVKYIYGMKESRMIQEIFVLGIHLISNVEIDHVSVRHSTKILIV